MANYSYRAVDGNSMILTGREWARDEAELERKLEIKGLTLIESETASSWDFSFGKVRISQQELIDFSYFMHLVLTSGIPLMSGMQDMVKSQANKKISYAAELLYKNVEAGMTLSDSMQKYPDIFPDYYIQMIKAGEKTGNLDKVFQDLISYIQWQMNLKKTIKGAMIYPSMILSAVTLLIALLFFFVMPKLQGVLAGLAVDLPLPTKMVLGAAGFVKANFGFLIVAAICVFAGFRMWLKTPAGRKKFDAALLYVPLIGQLVRKINLSRYFKTLSTLFSSGMNAEQSFVIASDVVKNVALGEALAGITDSVMVGDSISQAMQKSGAFTPFIIEMVSVGEKTGNFESVAMRISDVYDKDVQETVKKVFAYLEPMIIGFMGALVLLVMLSVFLPIYKILGGIRGR
jgi:type II secretory pathway component PulF